MNHIYLYVLIGLFSGFIGTSTAGSSLFSVPALMALGVPPITAIATNKVSALGTFIMGGFVFFRKGIGNWKLGMSLSLFSITGAIISTFIVLNFFENIFIGFIINIVVLLFIIFSFSNVSSLFSDLSKKTKTLYLKISFFLIGFFGAIFPGQGILATNALIAFSKTDYLHSAATRKIPGFCISIIVIIIYGSSNFISLEIGLWLFLGTFIGSYLGSLFAIKKGNKYVKYLFMTLSVVFIVKNIISILLK